MSYNTGEIRQAVRHAAEGNVTISVEQPLVIDVFEREANALFTPGLARAEVSRRGMCRMGLALNDDASSRNAVHFSVARSAVYGALVVHIGPDGCTGYTLTPLEL